MLILGYYSKSLQKLHISNMYLSILPISISALLIINKKTKYQNHFTYVITKIKHWQHPVCTFLSIVQAAALFQGK